jgi:hypothetical protein
LPNLPEELTEEKLREYLKGLEDYHLSLLRILRGDAIHKVKLNSADPSSGFIGSKINTDLLEINSDNELSLKNGGITAPGNLKYFGTDGGGVVGFHDLP